MENSNGKSGIIILRTTQHWTKVSNARINGIGYSAEDLWNEALAYFMWCDTNPIYKNELIRSGENAGQIFQVPIDRPYTLRGLCLHLGITVEYLYEVSRSNEKNEYFFVAKTILDIIHTQVLEGTLVGVYAQVAAVKHLGLGNPDGVNKPAPNININVIATSPALLTNETEISIPEDKK
jgi:hypothetical protein